MLSQFLIFRPSGLVEFNYQPGKNLAAVADAFIEDVLISERKFVPVEGTEDDDDDEEEEEEIVGDGDSVMVGTYAHDNYGLKYLVWTEAKERVFFVMVYPSLIGVKKPYEFLRSIKVLWENTDDKDKFSKFFSLKVDSLEGKSEKAVEPKGSLSSTPAPHTPEPAEQQLQQARKGKSGKKTKKGGKKSRKWNADGSYYEDDEGTGGSKALDFSTAGGDGSAVKSAQLAQLVGDKAHFGSKTKSGEFLVSDLSQEMDEIMSTQKKDREDDAGTSSSSFGFLRNIIGGKKIQKEDIAKVKSALSQHLIKKNVSPSVANSLIAGIEKELVGSKTASFTSVEKTASESLERQLIKLLTPNSSIDLLNEIQAKRRSSPDQPYVISVVGVNGVGKSTNLSKLAFWFLQNNYRVLITACDTFRSGAVEQLRTHVNNLTSLSPDKNQIELFEGGYGGSDLVAKIATGAIKYAQQNHFDIVLLDTAGRRHNDARLMAPLASFARAAKPDKIIMVGEALVGTDSVMQARNFDKAFGAGRHLDFFIVSKCDTVGDMIGSMVNMVFATGIPILFVGTGQTYTDIRTLSVQWAVKTLMS